MFTCSHVYMFTYLHICMFADWHSYMITYIHIYMITYRHIYISAYLQNYIIAHSPKYILHICTIHVRCYETSTSGSKKSQKAKIRIGISHINPLIMKPNKVGISR